MKFVGTEFANGRTTHMSLPDAWATWPLIRDHSWDLFITLTFPTPTKEARALQLWKRFADVAAKRHLPCRKARKEGLPWIAAIEKHQSGNCHVHALLSGISDFKSVTDLWLAVAGSKIIDVQRFNRTGTQLAYVTKAANTCDVTVARYFNHV